MIKRESELVVTQAMTVATPTKRGPTVEQLQEMLSSMFGEVDRLCKENSKLLDELERERMRLAACGIAALGYFDGCAPEYDSASLQDVLRMRGRISENGEAMFEHDWNPPVGSQRGIVGATNDGRSLQEEPVRRVHRTPEQVGKSVRGGEARDEG